jgi:hypothetical protein
MNKEKVKKITSEEIYSKVQIATQKKQEKEAKNNGK